MANRACRLVPAETFEFDSIWLYRIHTIIFRAKEEGTNTPSSRLLEEVLFELHQVGTFR